VGRRDECCKIAGKRGDKEAGREQKVKTVTAVT
jgi:hypothetical protein